MVSDPDWNDPDVVAAYREADAITPGSAPLTPEFPTQRPSVYEVIRRDLSRVFVRLDETTQEYVADDGRRLDARSVELIPGWGVRTAALWTWASGEDCRDMADESP